jgi:ABC-type amino acid transport substrate-binding protein
MGVKAAMPIFLFWLLCVKGTAFSADTAELRVCFLSHNLPYSAKKDVSGFDVETARAVAEVLGRALTPVWIDNAPTIIELEESDFPLRRLSRGECDAIFSVPGPEAFGGSAKLAVGAPYYGTAFELVGRGDGSVPDSLGDSLGDSLDTLGETVVGVQAQTIAQFVLHYWQVKHKTFLSPVAALRAVAAGEVSTVFLWGPTAGWYIKSHPGDGLVLVAGYEPKPVVCWNQHVATR